MSTVYILGAGFSMPFGYPSSRDLLSALNKFACTPDALDAELQNKWERCWQELQESKDDAVRCAFEGGNIEELFTVLDFHRKIASNRFSESADEYFEERRTSGKGSVGKINEERSQRARVLSEKYTEHNDTLREVLQKYFLTHHHEDHANWNEEKYNDLNRFAQLIQPGDTILTFNYDALAERALLACEKWAPRDGYGFEVNLEHAIESCRCNPNTSVKVFHLHGFIGWYDGESASDASGLDSAFLSDLGCQCKAIASINHKYCNLIAPSYLKTYVTPQWDGTKIAEIWAEAIQVIKCSSRVVVIGYSLPDADSAAMTLFLSITGKIIEVVNRETYVERRIRNLLEPITPTNNFIYHSTGRWPWDRKPRYDLHAWLSEQEAGNTQFS